MTKSIFIENVFELAFGDGAIDKGYTQEEVLEKLREFSDLALLVDEILDDVEQFSVNDEILVKYRERVTEIEK